FLMSKLFGNITGEISKSLETSSLPDNDSSDVHINTLSMVLIIILIIVSVSLAVFTTDFIMSITENYPIFQVILHSPSFFQSLLFLIGVIVLLVLSFRLSRELVLFLWLIYILMTGTSQITYFKEPMTIFMFIIPPSFINMGSKLILSLSLILILLFYLKNNFEKDELKAWMQETWFFVRSIFPLIIIGVTLAGFVKFFIPQEIIASLVGQNTIFSNLIAVLFGVFAYFPTLMEVPIARIFLDFGMARGPLLAYLLADPELSIQSILVTRKFLGDQKNLVFIGLVIVFTVFAGLLFGGIINEGIRLI
ncbi:permease, partial [Candidatus Hodarchaeum mangrovi]